MKNEGMNEMRDTVVDAAKIFYVWMCGGISGAILVAAGPQWTDAWTLFVGFLIFISYSCYVLFSDDM